MSDLEPITLALSVRPIRAALVVPEVDGLPWRRMFIGALETQTATWGGCGNLVLPKPVTDAHIALFWALMDVFDPDFVHGLLVRTEDTRVLAPALYNRRVAEQAEELVEVTPKDRRLVAEGYLQTEVLAEFEFEADFESELRTRLAPVDVGRSTGVVYGVGDPPPWPLVAVEKLRPLPDRVEQAGSWPDDDVQLLSAAAHGRLAARLAEALGKAGTVVETTTTLDPVAAWSEAVDFPARLSPLRLLAGLGLAQHFYPGNHNHGLVLCVGDTAWDFAFALSLNRLGLHAFWVPTRATNEVAALSAYANMARGIRGNLGESTIQLCTTSSNAAVSEFAAAFDRLTPGIKLERSSPLKLIPRSPGRFYEKDNVGFQQLTLVHDGTTPLLSTPVPRRVDGATVHDIYWMTDVEAEGWNAVRHAALGRNLLHAPGLMDGTARAGREGLSYLCPGVMSRSHLSLTTQAVRPKLSPLSFEDQVLTLFREAGWKAQPSDKGLYLQRSAEIFGGTRALVEALSDERAPLLKAFLLSGEAPGWQVRHDQRCLKLEDFEGLAAGSSRIAAALAEQGAITRGLVLKCEHCRATRFYRTHDVGDNFQCIRCRTHQPLKRSSWGGDPEPPWRYALAEVVYQFLTHDGDLPLLAVHDFLTDASTPGRHAPRRVIQYVGELELIDSFGVKSELDVIATDGTYVWVGEASCADRLAKTNDAETKRLHRLAVIAAVLSARGALLATSSASWNTKTITRARSQFPGSWPLLELASGARRA